MARARWLTRWSSDVSTQTGVIAAAWSVPGTLARGLLPRSPIDQAAATAVVTAVNYQIATTLWASIRAVAAGPSGRASYPRTMAVAAGAAAVGAAGSALLRGRVADSVVAGTAYLGSYRLANAAITGAIAATTDHVLHDRLHLRRGIDTTIVPAIASGAVLATGIVLRRQARARAYGMVDPDRRSVSRARVTSVAKAAAVGVGTATGLTAITIGEQVLARGIERAVSRGSGEAPRATSALLAHSLILGALGIGAGVAVQRVTRHLKTTKDVVEPAYPDPPTSPHVTAGPTSSIPFESIGTEGRRFVLMALTPEQITGVMQEPAITPVRVVGGYEAGRSVAERADLTLRDLEATGAFRRSLICVGAPTGVGYLNYTLTEALELLARGDCATVVPQYALVPSALALTRTRDGVELTRLVLEGIAKRIEQLPVGRRPRVVLFGESLGANVALDVSVDRGAKVAGIPEFDRLGVSAGLYFGVPFRTRFWRDWQSQPTRLDPEGRVVLVSEPDEVTASQTARSPHVLVVHHDDPVNKFAYSMVVKQPWWLGPPLQRPPMVPRETAFRPITSFVIGLVDLKNGMQSKPGTFVRRGHDYRIDCRSGVQAAFGFTASPSQVDAIEAELRRREQEWATRRMVARTLDRARRTIESTLHSWGQSAPALDIADIDPRGVIGSSGLGSRLGGTPEL